MIIVLNSRINRGGAEVRRLGGADAQAQAPPYAAHACSAAHVLDRISPIFPPFFPGFFPFFCAFSLPRPDGRQCQHRTRQAGLTARRSGPGSPLRSRASLPFLPICFLLFSPFFPNHFLKNDCRINHSLTSGLIWTRGRGRKMAGGRRLVPCLLSF